MARAGCHPERKWTSAHCAELKVVPHVMLPTRPPPRCATTPCGRSNVRRPVPPQVLHAALPYILKASARMTPPSFLTSCRPLAEPVSDDTVLDAHTVFTCPRPRPCHRTPRYL